MKTLLLILFCIPVFGQTFFDDPSVGNETVISPPQVHTYYTDASYVGTSTGSITQPWKTIQDGAALLTAGQSLGIFAGDYRETVTPAASGTSGNPILFEAMEPGVIVNGTELASGGWTVHSGPIYKKTITLPVATFDNTISSTTDLLANQIFKDRVMMIQARFPNVPNLNDLWDRTIAWRSFSTSTNTSITDAGAPAGMTGATLVLNGWYRTVSGTVSSHSGSVLNWSPGEGDPLKRDRYFLTNKLSLLDAEKEWHYEGGVLYFRQVGGGSPTGVEYKARNWGFNLTGRDYITIKGLEFFGCDPVTSTTATNDNIVIDGITATYMNHAITQTLSDVIYGNVNQTGIKLIGNNNVIKNSTLSYCASQCIWLGENGTCNNNNIFRISYEGNYGAGVTLYANTGNQTITNNTFKYLGRSAVDFGPTDHGDHINVEIGFNDMSEFIMLNLDGGAVYAGRHGNTQGWEVHHNWIYSAGIKNLGGSSDPVWVEGINTGLYFDQGTGPEVGQPPIVVHHNVLWDNWQTDYFCQPQYTDRTAGSALIYNNVFATVSTLPNSHSYKTPTWPTPVDVQRNNIYRQNILVQLGSGTPNVATSLLEGTNPLFVGTGTGGLAYRIQAGSPGVNTGTVLLPYTSNAVGNPDIGAYERGVAVDWVPGHTASVDPPPDEEAPPYLIEAENFTSKSSNIFSNGTSLISCDAGDWAGYAGINFTDTKDELDINYGRQWLTPISGTLEARLGSISGTLIGTATLVNTGAWATFSTITISITPVSGLQDIFIVFPAGSGDGNGDINWIEFK